MPNKRKKILFLMFSLNKGGGAERVLLDQIERLDQNVFDCHLCILNKDSDQELIDEIRIPKENKSLMNFNSLFDFGEWLRLIKLMRKNKFDLAYSHLFFANFVARIAGKISGIPRIIIVEHNVYLNRPYFERFINKITSYISYKIIAVSNSVKDYLIKYEKINPDKIIVIYNGVDLEKYTFNLEKRNKLRSDFGLTNEFVVISAGQVTLQKNYDLLIDIAYEVNKVLDEKVYFFIAGGDEGSLADGLKKKVAELGLEDRVFFLGLRDDIPDLLSMTDVFLMTSKWEGFGLALVEGMANGKPALVNKISTLEEIVGQNNKYGLVAQNAKEFADILIKLKKDRMFYEKYVNLSLQRSADFGLEKNIKQITKLLSEQ
jgi:glycosyltransferase involved in cell wall biosynthesis